MKKFYENPKIVEICWGGVTDVLISSSYAKDVYDEEDWRDLQL